MAGLACESPVLRWMAPIVARTAPEPGARMRTMGMRETNAGMPERSSWTEATL